ncbi:sigma-70 family RNA polymerase sigma factor [Cutibacterium sp. WCA-380-WT-3A]|uniref:Sigma-70 family RNA polymerase sigma factor n=1 Tax=Cutibacterium porci TaxID=2605781 RepID=A0A7K0J5W7_9ACTN|nr:sigma-70 family RNA polymerase sigma factor [Cutibacterium porci]MSS45340.1 sigma-70 family RNA polymerase sigma factor [Cutibacterium porci]
MKLTITSEPISNYTSAKARIDRDLEVTPEEVAAMIAADLTQRQQAADDPSTIKPRTAQDIVTELGRDEYNTWHTVWRQDRDKDVLCSWEVWNAHGNQDLYVTASAEDQFFAVEEQRTRDALNVLIEQLIDGLPEVQRAVAIAILVEQRPAVEVAGERGVNKAAVSQALKRAKTTLVQKLREAGVNSSSVSGLQLSDAQRGAQEGQNR